MTEKNRWSGLTISLCIVVVFYMILSHIGSLKGFFNSFLAITSTVIIGAVIAYTVNPLAVFIYKRLKKVIKSSENAAWILSANISLISVLALVVALLVVTVPMLVENITTFAMGLSGYMNSLKSLVLSTELDEDVKNAIVDFIRDQSSLTAVIRQFVLGKDITASGVIQFSASLTSSAFNFLIGIILAFYFLIGKKKLVELLSEFFVLVIPSKHYDNCKNVWNRFNAIFSSDIRTVCRRFYLCHYPVARTAGIRYSVPYIYTRTAAYRRICHQAQALRFSAQSTGIPRSRFPRCRRKDLGRTGCPPCYPSCSNSFLYL